ncbi:MAG: hypothetical protein J6W67_05375, partial [Lentisphaeria bacterium]|nr:hypothetical protein [Lentisphaeria bacterium]
MNKSLPLYLAAFAGSLSLGAFPLEWNVNNTANVPYEVEISRAKLEKLAGVSKDCGFEVTATTATGKKKLAVTLLEGKRPGVAALRFTVPAGTTSLDCEPAADAKFASADSVNIFKNKLTSSAWKADNGGKIKSSAGKVSFEATRFNNTIFTCEAAVPAGAAGRGAKFELDYKSLTPEVYPGYVYVEQIDAAGKVLSESLTDPRWTSLMRPCGVLTPHRESGRIHPKAKKLRVVLKAVGVKHNIGADGLPAKDKKVFLPKFEVSRLSVRVAEELPFPKYRDEFFSKGVSGKAGDCSFDTTIGSRGKAFFFPLRSHASWAEGKNVFDQSEIFYPINDGTVELWLKPEWNLKALKRKSFYTIFSAEPTQFWGPLADRNNKIEPCLALKYFPKAKNAVVEFKDHKKKKYSKTFKCTISADKWNHVAVQWSKTKGMQVYINGTKVFSDPKFTFTPVDYKDPSVLKTKDRFRAVPNDCMPAQFSLANTRLAVRSNKGNPNLPGKFDLLRISSTLRYKDSFVPATSFTSDKDTRALFNFDRSFDGKSGGGIAYISGSNMADVSRVARTIEVNGKTINYTPEEILDNNHPDKVLDKRNYTRVPNGKDFNAARKSEKLVFDFKGSTEKVIDVPETVFMDYIEYKNTGKTVAVHPFIRKDSEIDPRSFADIRNSMNISGTTDRERTNRIFQFMLSSSDYYASHQLYFEPGSDQPENACYKALTMLNSYCGFECGPLNNMTANMFTCAGGVPASQTGGYGHSFQQVWVDGKSNLYDLSAQKFFPAMDNETPAGLGEAELEPGIHNRVGGNSDHFIRLGTRSFGANTPAFTERVAMSIRPGETLRMWFINNGVFNNLVYNLSYGKDFIQAHADVTEAVHAVQTTRRKSSVIEVRRIFPHYGSAFLYFNDAPEKFAKNFTKVNSDSFCYNVVACFPVVYAEYAAKLKDGSFAKLEISTDRGKTFRELTADEDGTCRPVYPVCARREYLIRVNAPLKSVANFNAMTQMITNPRVMTAKLSKGKNKLLYTVTDKADVKVTLQYRKYVKDIDIQGEAVRTGSEKGFERIATVLAPGESKTFSVKGLSSNAKVKSTGKLQAALSGDQLTISVPDEDIKSVEAATIVDEGAEKQLVVVIHPGIELVTAKNITPLKKAKLETNSIQQSVNFSGRSASLRVNLAKTRPAGVYSIWNCIRLSPQQNWTRVNLQLPQGGVQEVFRHMNSASEFLKSRFYGEDGRGKFFWTYP